MEVPSKYADFVDVFSQKLTAELAKHIEINDYTIELIDDWQLFYGLIYNLGPVELEIL